MHFWKTTSSLVLAVVLTACSTEPSKPEISPAESEQRAELMRLLPKDADLTRMDEQLRWVERGVYITRAGKFEPLPEDNAYRRAYLEGRPAVGSERAETVNFRPITLELPENAK